ncbi:MAG: TRAP transporter TatT component family protein [Acidobacteriia bacterium]|nr:TRAP transporter TatT component family protein [Terriglobia bacterium]
MTKRNVLWSIALLLLCALPLLAQTGTDPRITQADKLYAERADLTKVKNAIGLMSDLLRNDPKNFEAAKRLGEYYYFLGKRVPEDQRLDVFQHGMDVSRKAIEIDPNKADGYFWLATNEGMYAETKGIMKSLSMRKEVRANFEKANQIDEKCYGGGPLRGLGRWDYRVPGLFGGDKKRSVQELEKSLQIDPGNSLTKLYLADSYMEVGRKEDARKQWQEVLTMTPNPRWSVEHKEDMEVARAMLKKYFKQ